MDLVLHQAALGSVPRSIEDPITTNSVNIGGFLEMMTAARDAGVKRFVYAASSSTYGDHPGLPKVESLIGKPLSPYAVTKLANELYADVFSSAYGFPSIGLRYFNIFGARQDPNGPYAAVIPKWIAAMIQDESVHINGDGETSRDFCYVANAVQANLLAATATDPAAVNQVYNVAVGQRTSLNQLFEHLRSMLAPRFEHLATAAPIYRDFRAGDVRHSLADIRKAHQLLGYKPTHVVGEGLAEAMEWYLKVNCPEYIHGSEDQAKYRFGSVVPSFPAGSRYNQGRFAMEINGMSVRSTVVEQFEKVAADQKRKLAPLTDSLKHSIRVWTRTQLRAGRHASRGGARFRPLRCRRGSQLSGHIQRLCQIVRKPSQVSSIHIAHWSEAVEWYLRPFERRAASVNLRAVA